MLTLKCHYFFHTVDVFFHIRSFTTVPRTRTRVMAKKWQRFELKTDEVTYCLACSREAYVTLTTAVSLSVFTGSERVGLLDSVWLIRGNELLLHLREASNGKINAVKDPAGGRENPKPRNPSWTNLTGNNGAACHPFKELFALRVIRSTWTSHTFLETSCHETREPLKQLKASVKWPESASKRSNSRLLPTSLFFQT